MDLHKKLSTLLLYLAFYLCSATIDLNLAELQYLADHLTTEECRRLVAAAHFKSFEEPNALDKAERKVPKDENCIDHLIHWNSKDGEGKGESHEILGHRLRQMGKIELADWLGKTVFHQLGEDLEKGIKEGLSETATDISSQELSQVTLEPLVPKIEEPTKYSILDSLLYQFIVALSLIILGLCFKLIWDKMKAAVKKSFQQAGRQEQRRVSTKDETRSTYPALVSTYVRDVGADSRQSRIDASDIRSDFREIRTELGRSRERDSNNNAVRDRAWSTGDVRESRQRRDRDMSRESGKSRELGTSRRQLFGVENRESDSRRYIESDERRSTRHVENRNSRENSRKIEEQRNPIRTERNSEISSRVQSRTLRQRRSEAENKEGRSRRDMVAQEYSSNDNNRRAFSREERLNRDYSRQSTRDLNTGRQSLAARREHRSLSREHSLPDYVRGEDFAGVTTASAESLHTDERREDGRMYRRQTFENVRERREHVREAFDNVRDPKTQNKMEAFRRNVEFVPNSKEKSAILINTLQAILIVAVLGQIFLKTSKTKYGFTNWTRIFTKEKIH